MSSQSKFQFRSLINRSPEEVFDWHLRDRIIERCIPPWENIEVICSEGRPNQVGSKMAVRAKLLGFINAEIKLEYSDFVTNESFSILAKDGIFKEYKYKTVIVPQSAYTSEVIDRLSFRHNFPRIFNPIINRMIKTRLSRILEYKHDIIDNDIGMIKKYPFEKPLKILVSGSHGLIGKNLGYFLEFVGHDVWYLTRAGSSHDKNISWDPKTGECDRATFEGFDIVVHLAGENIADGRWTKKKKDKVLRSRCKGTENLVEILKNLKEPPTAFISASAIGYYGSRGSEVIDEDSGPGKGLFISDVCEQWERASQELEESGIRVVHARFGMVLSSAAGALKKMLIPFKFGFGGKIGDGHQYVSWVAIDDAVGAIYHVIMTPSLKGAVNVVSPNPVPNDILTKKLTKRLNRWMGPPLPEFMIRILMGQKGEELLLTSTRAEPHRLSKTGYHFHYPKISQALEHII